MGRGILAVVVALAVLVPAAGAWADSSLQPGAEMWTSDTACTLGFVFDGKRAVAGRTYFATAAHCVDYVGQPVYAAEGQFGTVALIGDANTDSSEDYAFIRVDPTQRARVNPAVAGHPSYPTGYTTSTETNASDEIQISGYGDVFRGQQETREGRTGLLVDDDPSSYGLVGPIIYGDSGGPLVHIPSGKALGLVSRLCLGRPCYDEGPTVEGILARAAARGFTLAIRTAGD